MRRQQHVAQRLPDVVAPPQMSLLVGQHVIQLRPVHAAGQIDPGTEQAQQERRRYRVAHPDIIPQAHGLPHTKAQPQRTAQTVQQQRAAHRQPHRHQRRQIAGGITAARRLLHRLRGGGLLRSGLRLGRNGFRRTDGVHVQLNGGLVAAFIDVVEILHLSRLLHGGGSGHLIGRHRGLEADGAHQPHRHHGPQQAGDPTGCFFQQQPQHQHRQNQPSGGDAHVDQLYKDRVHAHPSVSSIMRRISARSSSVSFRPWVKAAIKAGSEPWKLSVTYCWLWRA